MIRMRTYFSILFGIAIGTCVGNGSEMAVSAQPAEHQGPQIVSHQTVDWTPFNSIAAVQVANVSDSEGYVTKTGLRFFPQKKIITLDATAAGTCDFRGQRQGLSLVASPGADVSDRVTCTARGIDRYRTSMDYKTTSKYAAGILAIDGSARIHTDWYSDDDRIIDRQDVATELHVSIQITGTTCRAISWRDASSGSLEGKHGSKQIRKVIEATAGTTCAVWPAQATNR